MKINIAIVDDLQTDNERLYFDICSWHCPDGVTLGSILRCQSGTAMLEQFEPGNIHIIFMDICMDELNGIETASRIREMDTSVMIVFITTSREFAFDAFPVHPFDYIIKPYKRSQLIDVLNEAARVLVTEDPEIPVRVLRTQHSLLVGKISAAISRGHTVEFILSEGQSIISNMTFAEVEELLAAQQRFLMCNRGLIINMDHVESTDSEVFRMKDGQDYPIRIRGRAKVLSDFSRYQFSRMRGTFMKHGEAK